jgi:hypothetical protein
MSGQHRPKTVVIVKHGPNAILAIAGIAQNVRFCTTKSKAVLGILLLLL